MFGSGRSRPTRMEHTIFLAWQGTSPSRPTNFQRNIYGQLSPGETLSCQYSPLFRLMHRRHLNIALETPVIPRCWNSNRPDWWVCFGSVLIYPILNLSSVGANLRPQCKYILPRDHFFDAIDSRIPKASAGFFILSLPSILLLWPPLTEILSAVLWVNRFPPPWKVPRSKLRPIAS